jgi:tryptophanyl-tRNA synthetase
VPSDEDELRVVNEGARPGSSVNAGLLFYPVLMAADILLYNADIVPTGEDQKQHLEMSRDLARRFNNTYSETFTIPEPKMGKTGTRIMSLADPVRKMSKSDENENGTLFILDEPEVIRKKVMSAVTDSGSEIRAGAEKPGIRNLLGIFCSISGLTLDEAENRFAGKNYGDFKKEVADCVIECLRPVRERYDALIQEKSYLEDVLREGNAVAQKRAYKTLSKVYRKIGFLERPR